MVEQPEREWISTGYVQEVTEFGSGVPEFDKRKSEHLWTVLTMHRVSPQLWIDPVHTPILDSESLLSIAGPLCYFCEEVYTLGAELKRCKGET